MSARYDDEIYFRERERQERQMAAEAKDPGVQHIHLRFAEAYARRARSEAGIDQDQAA